MSTGQQTDDLAAELLRRAVDDEQVAHRIHPEDDVDGIRRRVRQLARERGIRIRTGMVDGALIVIRVDARVWNEPEAVMRAKLTPRD
jgi:hypothetical protein